ncbi:MAG: hypothetical protein FWD89_05050 [Firmicutes bacterium]|nr:hypothetical protein [Bacillota bacterium]MCL2771650.1 hypothetical protein [Bacillota bacterium]
MKTKREIERVFLVRDPENFRNLLEGRPFQNMTTAYLDKLVHYTDINLYTRDIRIRNVDGICTFEEKSAAGGARGIISDRREKVASIGKDKFTALLAKTTARYENKRYYINLEDGVTAQLDVYGGAHEGMTKIDVEFENRIDAANFVPPVWFGEDITGVNFFRVLDAVKDMKKQGLDKTEGLDAVIKKAVALVREIHRQQEEKGIGTATQVVPRKKCKLIINQD